MIRIFRRIVLISLFITIIGYVKCFSTPLLENTNVDGFINKNLELLIFLTLLSVVPMLVVMTTSFTRIVVTLSFLKNASGVQNALPSIVLVGLSIILTFFIMAPVASRINSEALEPYFNKEISTKEAYNRGVVPLKDFMFKQTRQDDLQLFIELSKYEGEVDVQNIPITILISAFSISELKTSFQMGFLIFIPFLIIDMVIASVLMSMGMMMVSPAIISLPFKVLLLVLVDGFRLVVKSLFISFGGA